MTVLELRQALLRVSPEMLVRVLLCEHHGTATRFYHGPSIIEAKSLDDKTFTIIAENRRN